MRRVAFLAVVIATLVTVRPASADLILDFTGGDPGTGAGGINVTSITDFGGNSIAIDTLTVSGDGSYDGVYGVTGDVSGSLESNVGDLSFSTSPGLSSSQSLAALYARSSRQPAALSARFLSPMARLSCREQARSAAMCSPVPLRRPLH